MSDTERARLAALRSHRIMDTAPEPAFDDIAAIAADLFDAPIALVSLVDDERQWFKARVGLDARQTPRDQAFCAYALELARGEVMVVEDATQDPRFSANPLVTGEPKIRFYAGAVITDAEGHNLGTLCVIDTKARPRPSARELERLSALARRLSDALDRSRLMRLMEERDRLLALSEAISGVGHWRIDVATGAMTWSEEIGRIYGLPEDAGPLRAEEIFGRLEDTGAGHDPRVILRQAVETRSGFEYEREFRRADGQVRRLHARGACELDEQGAVVAVYGVVQDITEQKSAFDKLQRSQALYKLMAENMADVVTRIRLDGSSDYISPAVKTLIGYTPREMAGKPAQAFVYPPDKQLVLDIFARLARGEDEATLRHRAQHKDGHPVWVESRFRLVRDETGKPREMVAVLRDISAQKQLEVELAAARDAAEAANKAKSQFLANMSHELRTPLNGVIGFSRLLAESEALSAEDRRRVLLIRDAGEALNVVINDVLDFSKLEAGAVQLEARPFSVGDLVSEALSMVEPQAADKALSLRIEGADPGVVVGDKYRLRQVLLNFLSNAVKFTAAGAITVRLAAAESDGQCRLRIEVVDQGVGIAPEKAPALFKRFAQADGSVTRTFGGTGLGLAISRELVELMGGTVGVESRLGEGSTFWFEVTLPKGDRAGRREKRAAGRVAFPGMKVLVVDDVALNRELFEEMLQRHGCTVAIACDGAEAVRMATSQAYDLVLMDVHMPVMDGLAATRAIREAGARDLPILALTASGSPEQVEACMASGMNGHLLKPLSPQDLERALAAAFEGARRPIVSSPAEPDPEAAGRAAFEQAMGAATALKFVRMFEAELAGRFADDARAAAQADAHKIAGSAGSLGLVSLGEAARALDTACKVGGPYEAELAEARAAAARAKATLGAWRERLETEVAETAS